VHRGTAMCRDPRQQRPWECPLHGDAGLGTGMRMPRGKGNLLSETTIDRAFQEQSFDTELVLNVPVRWGLGLGLAGPHRRLLNPRTAYWGGTGGSFLPIDRDARMCFACAVDRMRSEPSVCDPCSAALRDSLFSVLRLLSV
jgi:hypothetical protein